LAPSAVHATVFVILLFLLAKRVPKLAPWSVLGRIAMYVFVGGAAVGLPYLLLAEVDLHELIEAGLELFAGVVLYFGVLALARERTLLDVVSYFRRAHPLLAARPAAS
jgi:hypothetical protein